MSSATASPTVLIIEDDPVFRRVLHFTVAKTGLAVEAVSDGETGFQRLLTGDISFLVTDFQVPRLEGIELLRAIQTIPEIADVPAVLCTAKGFELDSEQLRKEFGLIAVMHKPFSPRGLSELIVQTLRQRGVNIATPATIAGMTAVSPPSRISPSNLGAPPMQRSPSTIGSFHD
ncbi:response regulator [Roseiconus lacunae]|uniref:response regulator n=1 Tax=Roseiconus lacunae TaxID=2605694 RepID=UPI00308BDD16|nr:response regulator [Stieleria sp. HD01]